MTRKKLIEVALPLAAINAAAAREKSIRHGHPSTLHLWWARRPLAAARAVIFAQMVDDPGSDPERFPTEQAQRAERERLFRIIEELVQWENTTNEAVLERARAEIRASWQRTCARHASDPRAAELYDPQRLPAFHDPFAGGGALPLEAQRLGLESWASDLNPVAVTINKAMIEIPPRFAGRAPVGPRPAGAAQASLAEDWRGARGLAEDVRRYGAWMRARAQERIGALYPAITITPEMVAGRASGTSAIGRLDSNNPAARPDLAPLVGQPLTVIAWLWARTVASPNPAFADVHVPLASTFVLSSKAGKEAYVQPVIEGSSYRFEVRVGKPPAGAKAGTKLARANFRCILSDSPIAADYIKAEGVAGRMGARLMAIVAEGPRGRVYLAPTAEHEAIAAQAQPDWKPDGTIAARMTGGNCTPYGLTTWGDLFTPRQLVALTTFSDLVAEAIAQARTDALAAGLPDDGRGLDQGGSGATAYAQAVGVYLAFAVDYAANYWSQIATPAEGFIRGTFARQALPMTWDFAEAPPFGNTSGNWLAGVEWICKALAMFPAAPTGGAQQRDAQTQEISSIKIVSTDPPYYDNIGYADLSDFFYVWLRRALRPIYPGLFATLAVPKAEELVATPYRHGGKAQAEEFFLDGMTAAMRNLARQAHPAFPVTIYYAFKQSETSGEGGTTNTGWDTFLAAVIEAGFALTGTWPMRTERDARSIGIGANALASSIVLVCRPRAAEAPVATRREFIQALKRELPPALAHLQAGHIAPVDLAQAAIGPGMAVFSRHARVLDEGGQPLSVRTALALINQVLDETLAAQEGEFDADTRWALAWFEQLGFDAGDYGTAEQLSKAKNTAVAALAQAGIVQAGKGQVRLLRPEELPQDWDPATDRRLTVWEAVHHLVRVLASGGEAAAAELLAKLGARADVARDLCYRLYSICERSRRAQEALAYNALVQSWPEIARLAQQAPAPAAPATAELFGDN